MLKELYPKGEREFQEYQDLQAASKHDLLAAILVELREIRTNQFQMKLDNKEMLKKTTKYLDSMQPDEATKPSTP